METTHATDTAATVLIAVRVKIPADVWTTNYGTTPEDIPADVTGWVENTLHDQLVHSLGVTDADVRVDTAADTRHLPTT